MERTFNATVSLAKLKKKIDEKNYPTILYKDKNGEDITESRVRQGNLHKSWYKLYNTTLDDLLKLVMDGHCFSPTFFKGCYSDGKVMNYYATSDDFIKKDGKFYPFKTLDYNEKFTRENHVNRVNSNFESVQLLVIDIDEGFKTIDDVREAINFSVLGDCSFIYTTPSHSDLQVKVRVGWLLDEPIRDEKMYRDIISKLILYFKSDGQCKDSARYFFFGKELVYVNNDITFNIEQFKFEDIVVESIIKEKKRVKKGGLVYKESQNVSVETFIKYLEGLGYDVDTTDTKDGAKIRNFDWDYATHHRNARLFSLTSDYWLYYNEILTLATHCIWIEGGLKWLKEQMDKSKTDYSPKYYQILQEVKKHKYYPRNFIDIERGTFIAQEGREWRQGNTLLAMDSADGLYNNYFELFSQNLKNKKYYIKKLETMNTITLKEAENKLDEIFDSVIKEESKNKLDIHIIKCATGLGKTQQIKKLEEYGFCIATPTHALKNEIGDRYEETLTIDELLLERNKRIKRSKPISKLSEKIQAKLDYYYRIGLVKEASRFLTQINKGYDVGIEYTDSDRIDVNTYKSNMIDLFNSNETVFTTHSMALTGSYKKHHTIIFDEDPMGLIFQTGDVKPSDLTKLYDAFETSSNNVFKSLINSIFGKIKISVSNEIQEMPALPQTTKDDIINELIKNQIYNSKIVEFLFCNSFCLKVDTAEDLKILTSTTNIEYMFQKGIRYVYRRNLPEKKIIILSASINPDVYIKAFGKEKVHIYEIKNVELAGEIIQDTRYTFSKSSLKQENTIAYLEETVNKELPSISFRGNKWNTSEMYYFNLLGYDSLKGEDINVIGTPELPSWAYILLAKCIGYDIKNMNQNFVFSEIEYNGYKFFFDTFEDTDLRNLMLSMIAGEQIQAVGRNRSIRENCTTNLYARLPLEGAKFVYEKYN